MGKMSGEGDKRTDDQRSSQKILDRVETESSSFLLGGSTRRVHNAPEDNVELWGRRLGRGLAVVGVIALIGWLLYT